MEQFRSDELNCSLKFLLLPRRCRVNNLPQLPNTIRWAFLVVSLFRCSSKIPQLSIQSLRTVLLPASVSSCAFPVSGRHSLITGNDSGVRATASLSRCQAYVPWLRARRPVVGRGCHSTRLVSRSSRLRLTSQITTRHETIVASDTSRHSFAQPYNSVHIASIAIRIEAAVHVPRPNKAMAFSRTPDFYGRKKIMHWLRSSANYFRCVTK